MSNLQKAVPILASTPIDRTLTFYHEKLSFTKLSWKDKNYTTLVRDANKIYFWKCANSLHPKNTKNNIDLWYTETKTAGVIHLLGLFKKHSWGIYTYAILGKAGNMLKFGEELPQC